MMISVCSHSLSCPSSHFVKGYKGTQRNHEIYIYLYFSVLYIFSTNFSSTVEKRSTGKDITVDIPIWIASTPPPPPPPKRPQEVPVLVVFSPKHQKSARFVGAWEADNLSSFLVKALGGRAPMFPLGDETPR